MKFSQNVRAYEPPVACTYQATTREDGHEQSAITLAPFTVKLERRAPLDRQTSSASERNLD